jgi:ABC-type lipoprotein release transport system permease subunit
VFALLALAAAVAVLLRRRRGEVWVLRGLGVSPKGQARLRRAELVTASLYAGVAGLIAGAIVSVLTVATLARSSTPSTPRDLTVIVRFDVLPVAIAVIVLAAAFSVVVWRYGISVTSAAKAAKP